MEVIYGSGFTPPGTTGHTNRAPLAVLDHGGIATCGDRAVLDHDHSRTVGFEHGCPSCVEQRTTVEYPTLDYTLDGPCDDWCWLACPHGRR